MFSSDNLQSYRDPTITNSRQSSPKKSLPRDYSIDASRQQQRSQEYIPQQTYYQFAQKPFKSPQSDNRFQNHTTANDPQSSPLRGSLSDSQHENFYSDNQKLRNSLNQLRNYQTTHDFYSKYGDQPQDINKKPPSTYTSTNVHNANHNTSTNKKNDRYQYHNANNYSEPKYSHQVQYSDSNNNNYPMYLQQQNDRLQNEADTPPEPPPRRKSSFRAVQKSKHPEYTQNHHYNSDQQNIYRMPNGVEIIQNQDGSEAMYV